MMIFNVLCTVCVSSHSNFVKFEMIRDSLKLCNPICWTINIWMKFMSAEGSSVYQSSNLAELYLTYWKISVRHVLIMSNNCFTGKWVLGSGVTYQLGRNWTNYVMCLPIFNKSPAFLIILTPVMWIHVKKNWNF